MSLRDTVLALFGMCAAPRPALHDDRVHDAANREAAMVAKLRMAGRAGERILEPIIEAQRTDTQSDDLRRGAATLRESIEHRKQQIDAFDSVFRGKDKG